MTSSAEQAYVDYIEKAKDRLQKGLPPLGPALAVTCLPVAIPQKLYVNPESHVQVRTKSGNIRLKSVSPEFPYFVLFKDGGEVASLYAMADLEEGPVTMDALQIYNTRELSDSDKEHLYEIVWSESALTAALLINNQFYAVIDFCDYHACCKTGFPPVNPNSSFGEFSHQWDEECIKCFLAPS